MEQIFEQAFTYAAQYLNFGYLIAFMLLSYFVKQNFKDILSTIFKWNPNLAIVVFILATLIAVPYLVFGADWQKILISYAFGTSLHELIFTYIEKKFKS